MDTENGLYSRSPLVDEARVDEALAAAARTMGEMPDAGIRSRFAQLQAARRARSEDEIIRQRAEIDSIELDEGAYQAALKHEESGWWEQAFPGTTGQAGLVRAMAGQFLAGCPVADDVVRIMSELVANAVRHSRSGRDGGTFTARLMDVPGQYVLGEIVDSGSDWDGDLQRSARDASGLRVVLALSAACGAPGGRHGRTVWFQVRYPCAGTAPAAQAVAPGALPPRVPGTQGLPFPAPRWDPCAPGRAAAGPEVLERVHAALTRR